VQEALTNAIRHGVAWSASIAISEDENTLRITVRDDGHDFDPAARATGFGLIGMRDRAEVLGGALEVESAIGHGTIVRAAFPGQRRSGERVA